MYIPSVIPSLRHIPIIVPLPAYKLYLLLPCSLTIGTHWAIDQNTNSPLKKWLIIPSGGCFQPLWKYDFVNWDDYYSQYFWENKIDVPNQQPAIVSTVLSGQKYNLISPGRVTARILLETYLHSFGKAMDRGTLKRCLQRDLLATHMGVSINGGSQKWMVYRENPAKMDDLGVPLFQEPPICECPSNIRISCSAFLVFPQQRTCSVDHAWCHHFDVERAFD